MDHFSMGKYKFTRLSLIWSTISFKRLLPVCFFSILAHSMGVSVNATKPDKAMANTTVSP